MKQKDKNLKEKNINEEEIDKRAKKEIQNK